MITFDEKAEYIKLVNRSAKVDLNKTDRDRLAVLSQLNAESTQIIRKLRTQYQYQWDIEELKKLRTMQKDLKKSMSFSSFLEGANWHTQINFLEDTIQIRREKDLLFEGSIDEFKALEKLKANNTDRIYSSILTMAEELIHLLSKA